MRKTLTALALAAAPLIHTVSPAGAVEIKDVLANYADIAQAAYEDSLSTAQNLSGTVNQFLATPNQENLDKARAAWVAARIPYAQTEVFRFGNAIVDDWQQKVNAWPVDEGLIDYVDIAIYGQSSEDNPYYTANIIANDTLTIDGQTVDASTITPELLERLHQVGDIETNVTTGYHAIEFLLWGQDVNGTGSGAGNRPATDFDPENCTNDHCDRRAAYLQAATDLLVSDLEEMVQAWRPEGEARADLLESEPEEGLKAILAGMGSLSYGELAGDRMSHGLLLNDAGREHDEFSDNTPATLYYNAVGIENVYLGEYRRVDDSVVKGASLSELVAAKDAAADESLKAKLNVTVAALKVLVDRAAAGEQYDQMLAADNTLGNAVIQTAIVALLNQTEAITAVSDVLGLDDVVFEGAVSLDNPETVIQ